MNTEQLKTDVAKFIISKGVDNRNIMGPSGYLQLDDLLTNFASQESNKAVSEFKEKLKRELKNASIWNNPMVNDYNAKAVNEFIDKL